MKALIVAALLILMSVPVSAQWFHNPGPNGSGSFQNSETGQDLYYKRNQQGNVYLWDRQTGQGQWIFQTPSSQIPPRRGKW